MISQTAEYALRAMVHLAGHNGKSCTVQVVAEGTKIPEGYLAKVMQSLARGGLLISKRGLHGGFSMAKPIAEISVHDVISTVDPIRQFDRCPLDLPWHGEKMCHLHATLNRLVNEFENEAKRASIADLLPADASGAGSGEHT